MTNDIVADTLARIKNGVVRKKDSVEVLNAKLVKAVLEVMKQEEFINEYAEEGDKIIVTLRYHENGEPAAQNFKRVSKPGQRIYVNSKQIVPVVNGRGISIISTSAGVMSGARAKAAKLGGEYICEIW